MLEFTIKPLEKKESAWASRKVYFIFFCILEKALLNGGNPLSVNSYCKCWEKQAAKVFRIQSAPFFKLNSTVFFSLFYFRLLGCHGVAEDLLHEVQNLTSSWTAPTHVLRVGNSEWLLLISPPQPWLLFGSKNDQTMWLWEPGSVCWVF